MSVDPAIELRFALLGNGQAVVSASVGEEAIFTDRFAVVAAHARDEFLNALCADRPGLDQETLRQRLEEIAAKAAEYGTPKRTVAQQLLRLIEGYRVDLFHSPGADAEAYAIVPVRGHRDTLAIKSVALRRWLYHEYLRAFDRPPGADAVQAVITSIAAQATLEGPARRVFVRIGRDDDGNTYLDLGNDRREVVRMTPGAWTITRNPPVYFVRPRGLLPLPVPVRGGAVTELQAFVNVRDESDWALLVGFLHGCLNSSGPYPLLAVAGEQGSAKSTLTRIIRLLIDPNVAAIRAEPRDVRELLIAAGNAWVIAIDNVSTLQPWLSDALCRLATGGGFSARQLYTDDEERLFDTARPAVLNGIEDVASRPDLLDRCVTITLRQILDEERRTERELMAMFEVARPRILGALLNAACAAMQNLPNVRIERPPRMADFAHWVVAAEKELGLSPGLFLDAYGASRASADAVAMEAAAIADPLRSLAQVHGRWEGTTKDLLAELEHGDHSHEATRRRRDWPGSPRKLSGLLRRLAPALRRAGIVVEVGHRSSRGRLITLEYRGVETSEQSLPSPTTTNEAMAATARAEDGDGRAHNVTFGDWMPVPTRPPVDRGETLPGLDS